MRPNPSLNTPTRYGRPSCPCGALVYAAPHGQAVLPQRSGLARTLGRRNQHSRVAPTMKYQIPPDVLTSWTQGDKIEAIRALRELTGLGLKEAKEALESGEYSVAISPPQPGTALPPAVLSAMARGDKVQAIKLAREATGLGLKEAKEAVEAAATGAPASVHRSARNVAPGEVLRSRINWVAIATFFGLALVALLFAPKLLGP